MTTNDPCARPMPDTPAPGEERRTVCVYDKLDPDYVFRPDDAGEYRMQVDRRSETRPAPMPDTKLCGAVTQAGEGRKFRTCELPSGHEGRHKSHLGGETVWWENTGPECEHGHLARVCVTCELIAAEARVAELEAELESEKNRIHDRMLQWRGIFPDGGDAVCKACQGAGVKVYGDSTMWRGGIGGQVITSGVCDGCWGSGTPDRPWTNLRTLLPAAGKEPTDAE